MENIDALVEKSDKASRELFIALARELQARNLTLDIDLPPSRSVWMRAARALLIEDTAPNG